MTHFRPTAPAPQFRGRAQGEGAYGSLHVPFETDSRCREIIWNQILTTAVNCHSLRSVLPAPKGPRQDSPGQSGAATAAQRRPGLLAETWKALKGRNRRRAWTNWRYDGLPYRSPRSAHSAPVRPCRALSGLFVGFCPFTQGDADAGEAPHPLCPGLCCRCPSGRNAFRFTRYSWSRSARGTYRAYESPNVNQSVNID